jgi:hypothetical protein
MSERSERPGSGDELDLVLSDPSTWVEPDPALEDRVMAAIAAEVAAAGRHQRRTGRRGGQWRLAVAIAGAAAVVLAAAVVSVGALRGNGGSSLRYAATLAPIGDTPTTSASATLTRTVTGWRVYLEADGLPRLDNGHYYEAWLGNRSGDRVAVGTFNQGEDVTLWSGVSPQDYPMITVTAEDADGNPAPSAQIVLTGAASRRK